jgi:hypothetical protein
VAVNGGRLDLVWPGLAVIQGLELHACLAPEKAVFRTNAWDGTSSNGLQAQCGPVVASLGFLRPEVEYGLRLKLSIRALEPVEVIELQLTGELQMEAGDTSWALLNGYQSWDEGEVRPIGSLSQDEGCESWWTIAIADANGQGLAAVAASAVSCYTCYQVTRSRLLIKWCEAPGTLPKPVLDTLAEGERWEADGVLLGAAEDIWSALPELAGAGTEQLPDPVPQGWLSWYHFGPWVSRDDVLQNAHALLDEAGGASRGVGEITSHLIQVDDGWQEAYGDWVPNTKFAGGLDALAQELNQLGFVLGLWIAPFLVSATSELAATAPEKWFVHDPQTQARWIDPRHTAMGPMQVLDGSNPDVCQHLARTFERLYRTGARYFKIDFLYAGAQGGVRSLRLGLAAIREGAKDAYLLASGAPLLPVAHLTQGCRVGPDTATPWYDPEIGAARPTIFGDEIQAVARAIAARSFLRPWFQLDPDVALVGGNLTLEQGRQLVTLAALTGGPFLAGDDLTSLAPERRALLTNPEVLGLAGGEPARPDWEPALQPPPSHWRRQDVLAVFNWEPQARDLLIRAPGASGARDLWAQMELPQFRDGIRLEVPGHGVKLLRLH